MVMVVEGAKPQIWAPVCPALVDPKWRWAWIGAELVLPMWEGHIHPFDLHGRQLPASINGTPTMAISPFGSAIEGDGAAPPEWIGYSGKQTVHGDLTIATVVLFDAIPAGGDNVIFSTHQTLNQGWRIGTAAATTLVLTKGGVAFMQSTAGALTAGVYHFVGISYDHASGDVYFFTRNLSTDAVHFSTANNAGAILAGDGTWSILGGGWAPLANLCLDGKMAMFFGKTNYVPVTALQAWSQDPFGPFRMVYPAGIDWRAAAAPPIPRVWRCWRRTL